MPVVDVPEEKIVSWTGFAVHGSRESRGVLWRSGGRLRARPIMGALSEVDGDRIRFCAAVGWECYLTGFGTETATYGLRIYGRWPFAVARYLLARRSRYGSVLGRRYAAARGRKPKRV